MYQETAISKRGGKGTGWVTVLVLGSAFAAAAFFLVAVAFPYFAMNPGKFGGYWVLRGWLLLHIAGGAVALASGPFVLWLGLNRRRMLLHRTLGFAYMSGVGVSSVAAFYLAFHTASGWVFGAGLTGLGIAWVVTTGMALAAVRWRQIAQHQEWMIRSYVVTFAFVGFRICVAMLHAVGIGTLQEQLGASSWFCWALPLLITEVSLQGRKIFAAKPAREVGGLMANPSASGME